MASTCRTPLYEFFSKIFEFMLWLWLWTPATNANIWSKLFLKPLGYSLDFSRAAWTVCCMKDFIGAKFLALAMSPGGLQVFMAELTWEQIAHKPKSKATGTHFKVSEQQSHIKVTQTAHARCRSDCRSKPDIQNTIQCLLYASVSCWSQALYIYIIYIVWKNKYLLGKKNSLGSFELFSSYDARSCKQSCWCASVPLSW